MLRKKFFWRSFGASLVALIMLVLPVFTSFSALALTPAQMEMFSQNNILFYDPSGTSCYSGNLSGNTIMAKVVDYLKGNNPTGFVLSNNGIAGVLANFQGESGFNPFRFEGDGIGGPGYGIAQFTPMSNITDILMSDSRTSNYFNQYFDLKYTYYDSETGLPKEPVPMTVVDAWLSVQMDFFFGASSEFENTKVGDYRNAGGIMGLDYINSGMTVHEALNAAQSPEDATRIFVWIMERPGDKEGASNLRSRNAQEWYEYSLAISAVGGTEVDGNVSNGSDVTIIGDSITVGSEDEIRGLLPQVDIYAQTSKQFYNGVSDNPGGFEILQSLVENNSLRNVLVYALGTNSSGVTEAQVKEVVALAGSSRRIIFVTNYTTADSYIGNNNNYMKAKNDNSNVLVAGWKAAVESQPEQYLADDGIHPNVTGRKLFANIIFNTINETKNTNSICFAGSVNGGLSNEQAQRLADYYNGSEVDADSWGLPFGKMNCVSFSKFFVERFTDLPHGGWPNGKDVAHTLASRAGLSEGIDARPFAVFSVTKGSTVCNDGHLCGHTGIVVAVNGDDLTTIEAAYQAHDARVIHRNISYFKNSKYGNTFTYIDSVLNYDELAQIVGN